MPSKRFLVKMLPQGEGDVDHETFVFEWPKNEGVVLKLMTSGNYRRSETRRSTLFKLSRLFCIDIIFIEMQFCTT